MMHICEPGLEIYGPDSDGLVEAWANEYIPLSPTSTVSNRLRDELRRRLSAFQRRPGTVLNAVFAGPLPRGGDVENYALYNIGGRLAAATSEGLRFEHQPKAPPSRTGKTFRHAWRYQPVRPGTDFVSWREVRPIARWRQLSLPHLQAGKEAGPVWYAVRHGEVDCYEPRALGERFAVRLILRSPEGRYRSAAAIIKGFLDGVISGFQAHSDFSLARQASHRLASPLGVSAAEVYESLVRTDRALLGFTDRLVDLRATGVQWKPDDHECVAAELQVGHPGGVCWIAGHINIVEPSE